MSLIGTPIQNSLVQTAQAQQQASKARDRARAVTEEARRFQDTVDLRVAGVESADAIRPVSNDPDQADERRQDQQPRAGSQDDPVSGGQPVSGGEPAPRIDVKG